MQTSRLYFSFSLCRRDEFAAAAQPQLLRVNLHYMFYENTPIKHAHACTYMHMQPSPNQVFFFFVSHPPLSIVTAHCQQRRIRSIWLACCLATVTMASDSLWRQGWDRENASGNDLMGKCAVIITVHFLSLRLSPFEWKCFLSQLGENLFPVCVSTFKALT